MRFSARIRAALLLLAAAFACTYLAHAQGDPHKVKHIIVIMQENHSFDNYFGALAYAPGSPYHSPRRDGDGDGDDRNGGCRPEDHSCVDGLTCRVDAAGNFRCSNSNLDDDGSTVFAFHDSRRCVAPDLDHGWTSTHHEANFLDPNGALGHTLSDGFVRVNDVTEQVDKGVENPTDDQTMNFYNQDELPFYYDLAQKFAISDRYFCSVLGPTFPNRSYLMAATSFGHLTTSEIGPPAGTTGYKPITGTILDLMEANKVTWADYFQDFPQGGTFRSIGLVAPPDPHFLPLKLFLAQVAGVPGVGTLPQVSFVDPNFGLLGGFKTENDEHPPTDIQRGQAFVSQVVNAVRNGPLWQDSIILITYDEHGGSYDHVAPPRAQRHHAPNPDGINPGQCADLSNPPASEQPGGGAQCTISKATAAQLCPGFSPTGPFPGSCANFDQLGFRVPFMAISPFSKPHYVSHTTGDHTSILALIETIFMTPASVKPQHGDGDDDDLAPHPHLTLRDQFANPLLDMFDFNTSPSLNTRIGQAAPPAQDCTPQ
ncbi:MAG TPA: alkaline phosphatase family protein [Candidatus Angelobacter sp.]|nr:alkaline phosphatase family protein [Candidatus Angelobacter sp.]